jgi:hypothetical protein
MGAFLMIDVRINKLKERIALVWIVAQEEKASITFHYRQAKEIINRILREKGVFSGKINEKMTVGECRDLAEKITKAHNTVNFYIATDIEVDDYFSKTYGKWVIKISNRFGKVRYLACETVNSFLTEVKITKIIAFQDQSSICLTDAQIAGFALKLCAARQRVIVNNQPLTESKPWLQQTFVLDS